MSQSTALLDADLTAYFDDFGSPMTHEPSRPMQWLSDAAVTVVMILLAPILAIPIALAFVLACIRMQRCDVRHYATRRYRSPSERLASNRFAATDLRIPLVTSYRWN
jgi:hypothetical protein